MEKINVVFSTVIGNISVNADVDFSVSEKFLSGAESFRENINAVVCLDKADAYKWSDKHKKYSVDLGLAVRGDIRTLQKQNAQYAEKETDGRHHVDLNTLKINKIWIDGKYLRIVWCFNDCYGCKRLFSGNMYAIYPKSESSEDFFCASKINLEVYF